MRDLRTMGSPPTPLQSRLLDVPIPDLEGDSFDTGLFKAFVVIIDQQRSYALPALLSQLSARQHGARAATRAKLRAKTANETGKKS